MRAAALAEYRLAQAAQVAAAYPGAILAEWSRWRRAGPGDLAEPLRPPHPPPVVTAEVQVEAAAAAHAKEKARAGGGEA